MSVRIRSGWPKIGPSGNTLAVIVENDDGTAASISALNAAPTYTVNGGPPITGANPLYANNGYILFPLNPPPIISIIDDPATDTDPSLTGSDWTRTGTGVDRFGVEYGGYHHYALDPTAKATVSFTGLVPGTYRVSSMWRGASQYTASARFQVKEGSAVRGTFDRSQKTELPLSRVDLSYQWGDLGTATIAGTSCTVEVTNHAGADYLWLDAIRLEQILPPVVSPGDTVTFSASSGWLTTTTGSLGASSAISVALATDDDWFPVLAEEDRRLKLGLNFENPGYDNATLWYADLGRVASPWVGWDGSAIGTVDDYGELVTVTSGFYKTIFRGSCSNGIDFRGTPTCTSGVYTYKFKKRNSGDSIASILGYEHTQTNTAITGPMVVVDDGSSSGQVVITQSITFDEPRPTWYVELALKTNIAIYELKIFPPEVPSDWDKLIHPIEYDRIYGKGFERIRSLDMVSCNDSPVVDFSDYGNPLNRTRMMPNAGHSPWSINILSLDPVDLDPDTDVDLAVRYFGSMFSRAAVRITTDGPHNLKTGQPLYFRHTGDPINIGPYPNNQGGTLNLGGSNLCFVTSPTTFTTLCGIDFQSGTGITTLASRQTPSGAQCMPGQLPGMIMVPIVDLIQGCNELGVGVHFPVAHAITDAAATTLFDTFAEQLEGKLYLEDSNEVWHFAPGYSQTDWFWAMGIASSPQLSIRQAHVKRSAELWELARDRFEAAGRPRSDVVRVLASQGGYATYATRESVEYAEAHSIDFDELSVGTYIENYSLSYQDPSGFPVGFRGSFESITAAFDALDVDGLIDLYGITMRYQGLEYFYSDPLTSHRYFLDLHGFEDVIQTSYEGAPESLCHYRSVSVRGPERVQAVTRHWRWYRAQLSELSYCQELGLSSRNRFIWRGTAGVGSGYAWASDVYYDQIPGKGDGSDGKYDNRINPYDLRRAVSVQGQAYQDWAALTGDVEVPVNPTTVSVPCVAWISAQTPSVADGTALASVAGGSGNGEIAAQATSADRPLYRTRKGSGNVNGQPSIHFDGSNDYLTFGNLAAAAFGRNDPFSLAVVFRAGAMNGMLMAKANNSTNFSGYYLIPHDELGNDRLNFTLIDNSGTFGSAQTYGSTVLTPGTAYIGFVTYDGSGHASGTKLYLGKVRETETYHLDALSSDITNSDPVTIGSRAGGGVPFAGDICEAAWFPGVLTAQDISDLTDLWAGYLAPNITGFPAVNTSSTSTTQVVIAPPTITGATSYQWYRSVGTLNYTPGPATALAGATSATLTDTTAAPGVVYGYYLVASNAYSSNTSFGVFAKCKDASPLNLSVVGQSTFTGYGADGLNENNLAYSSPAWMANYLRQSFPWGWRDVFIQSDAFDGMPLTNPTDPSYAYVDYNTGLATSYLTNALANAVSNGSTHVLIQWGVGDAAAGNSVSKFITSLQVVINAFVGQGQKVILLRQYRLNDGALDDVMTPAVLERVEEYQMAMVSLCNGSTVLNGLNTTLGTRVGSMFFEQPATFLQNISVDGSGHYDRGHPALYGAQMEGSAMAQIVYSAVAGTPTGNGTRSVRTARGR